MITAAVPQANTSREPAARGVGRHSSKLTGRSTTSCPASRGQRDDRVAGDAGQDRAGQRRRDQRAVVVDEEDVHAAELVDVPALHRVEEDHLVAAVLDRLGLGGEADAA